MYDQKPWLSSYEPGVPHTLTYSDAPIPVVLAQTARRFPNKIAMRQVLKYLPVVGAVQGTMTYAQLDAAVTRFAASLARLGVRPGDRVALMLPNLAQSIISLLGVQRAGAIVVNVNPTYTPRELEEQLCDSGAETIILLSSLVPRLEQIRSSTPVRRVIAADISDRLRFPLNLIVRRQLKQTGLVKEIPQGVGALRFDDLLRLPAGDFAPPPQAVEDVAVFQYTSGTTGTPKAAMLTHRNLLADAAQIVNWLPGLEEGNERFLGAIPFFHVYGMTMGVICPLLCGGEAVLTPDPRSTLLILEIIQRQHITIYPAVPAMYNAILNHKRVSEFDLRSIKVCISGASSLPMDVQVRFGEITGGRLVEGYGLTETSPTTHANPVYGRRKDGSIGVPLADVEARIIALEPNAEGERPPAPVGEEGELCVRGPQVMKGYWGRDDETANVLDAGGWLRTGDIARMDEDGYFYIVDRKKDLIIASGYNIVPREVEEVLFSHPAVLEAAVAGVPDRKRGETVKGFVVLHEGQDATEKELLAFCRENLAPYKVPTTIEFRKELPRSQAGKVLRRVLVHGEDATQSQQFPTRAATEQTPGETSLRAAPDALHADAYLLRPTDARRRPPHRTFPRGTRTPAARHFYYTAISRNEDRGGTT